MKRIIMAVVATMCPVAVLSQQVSSIPEIIAFMSTNDYRRCFAITNEIDSVMASTTGILERATCKLLKVSILLDHSANMANEDTKGIVPVEAIPAATLIILPSAIPQSKKRSGCSLAKRQVLVA